MNLHDIINAIYDKFIEQYHQYKVVLLHPDSRYRSILVAKLVNSEEINTFYYAMGPDDINLEAFVSSITHDIAHQRPTFGRHINALPNTIYTSFNTDRDMLLTAFANDLRELSNEDFILILDEFDRSDTADEVQLFIEKLANHMPAHCRILINSRTLPRLPWVSLIAQQQAALLLDGEIINEDFYGNASTLDTVFEVYALGPGFVLQNNEFVDSWEGHLPRLLFFFALDRPMITRSDICRAFWPELTSEQAVNVFHVTKRRLHKALDDDVLVHEGGYYKVNPKMAIYYDVVEFVQALMQGRDTSNEYDHRIESWQNAINLYRGPFLQGHDDEWIIDRRANFLAGYIEAVTNMAHHWENVMERPEQSLALIEKALKHDPLNEDLHRELMRLYAVLGRRNEAALQYNSLAKTLKKQGRKPQKQTQELLEEIGS